MFRTPCTSGKRQVTTSHVPPGWLPICRYSDAESTQHLPELLETSTRRGKKQSSSQSRSATNCISLKPNSTIETNNHLSNPFSTVEINHTPTNSRVVNLPRLKLTLHSTANLLPTLRCTAVPENKLRILPDRANVQNMLASPLASGHVVRQLRRWSGGALGFLEDLVPAAAGDGDVEGGVVGAAGVFGYTFVDDGTGVAGVEGVEGGCGGGDGEEGLDGDG